MRFERRRRCSRNRELREFREIRVYEASTGCLLTLSMQTFRNVVLEYSQVHKKAYDLLVCEFGSFESALRHCGHSRHSYITSTDVMILLHCIAISTNIPVIPMT